MHLPIRDLASESHRGLRAAVAELSFAGDVDWHRACEERDGMIEGVTGRKSAERVIKVRIVVKLNCRMRFVCL
jgi:hypothetical protein